MLNTPHLTSRKSYTLHTAAAYRCTWDTRKAEAFPFPRSLPLLGRMCISRCDKEATSQLQIFSLPKPQSCCPELKMSIKRVYKLKMTCLLYDFSYGKYMPPHTLGFQLNSGPVSVSKLQFSNYSVAWS